MRPTAKRANNAPAFVMRVATDDDGNDEYWVSWYEKWTAGNGSLSLNSVGWTFFVGLEGLRVPLLRAEWGDEPKEAAQPHWHFDKPVEADALLADELGDRLVLAEYSFGDIHCGMAGWRNKPENPWRHANIDPHALAHWASQVLSYTVGELQRIRKTIVP